MATQVHPSAFVHPGAQLGEDVVIGPCALIEEDVIIGDRSRVDTFASVKRYTRMGTDNHIHSYACVGGEPQDLKFHGEESWLEIGNGNNIREFSTQHRGTEAGGCLTRIGDNNLLMAYTHVAHDCMLGNNIVMSNNATLAGHVTVGDFAIISGLSAVHQFVRIGEYSFVAGMSGIPQDLPPFMLAVGGRASVHGPNLVGLRRMRASRELIAALKAAFRLIWHSETPRKEALEQLEYEQGHYPEIMSLVNFIRASERGILSADRTGDA